MLIIIIIKIVEFWFSMHDDVMEYFVTYFLYILVHISFHALLL